MSWEGWFVQRVNVVRALNCDQIQLQASRPALPTMSSWIWQGFYRKERMRSLCRQHLCRKWRWRHLQKLQCWLCRRPQSCQLLFRHFICAFSQWSILDCFVLGPHATSTTGFPLVHRGHLASSWERCRHRNDFKAFLTQPLQLDGS